MKLLLYMKLTVIQLSIYGDHLSLRPSLIHYNTIITWYLIKEVSYVFVTGVKIQRSVAQFLLHGRHLSLFVLPGQPHSCYRCHVVRRLSEMRKRTD